MKTPYILFSLLLFISFTVKSQALPSKAMGKYAGVKPAYTAVKNEVEFSIDEQDVFITFKEDILFLEIGNLTLSGGYVATKISGGNYSIKANMSNDKSLNFELELLWSKKSQNLTMIGKNGEPDTVLEKLN